MDAERRRFLGAITAIGAFATPILAGTIGASTQQSQGPAPLNPGRSGRPNTPAEESAAPPFRPDPRMRLKENQKDIAKDVEELYRLASELKKEVEKTDSVEVLSLSLVKKAQQIEKLAKRIQNLARGQ